MHEAFAKYVEKNGKTFTVDCKASSVEEGLFAQEDEAKKPEKIDREYAVSPDHPNALVVNCVQVSTFYNKNDHYFIPAELWKAKETSKCMIADWDHDRDKIIGCISDTYAVDQEGEVLEENFEVAEDTAFDIYNEVVVWKKQFPERAEEITAMHAEGNLFVSMECTFEDFNFALQKDGAEAVLVSRNEATDFLTDSLLIFGGSGKYQDYRVGIAFEDISFVGIGFCEKPANERSHVLEVAGTNEIVIEKTAEVVVDIDVLIEANKFTKKTKKTDEKKNEKDEEKTEKDDKEEKSGVKDSKEEKTSVDCAAQEIKKGEESMEFEKLYEEASESLKGVTEEVATLKAELANAAEVRTYSRKDGGENQYSYMTTDYDGNEVKVTEKTVYTSDSVTTVTEELVAKIAELSAQKEEIAGQLKEASESLEKIETARKQEARTLAIAEKDVEIEDEELFAMSDGEFDTMIKFAPAKKVEEEVAEVVEEKTDEEKEEIVTEEATEKVQEIKKDEQKTEVASAPEKKSVEVVASMLRNVSK